MDNDLSLLAASLISIRIGISVALIGIGLGVVGGNALGLTTTPWIDFLAAFGAVLLTFLAGAEIDPGSLRRHLHASLVIGAISFAAPFGAVFLVAYFGLGWSLEPAEIAGLSLSTISVAVVYAVMIESGVARQELGKLILAACFVTDLGTVLFPVCCSRTWARCCSVSRQRPGSRLWSCRVSPAS